MEQSPNIYMPSVESTSTNRPVEPCLLVFFGACGDLTKRMLLPAVYNMARDKLLPDHFAIVGADLKDLTTEQFLAQLSDEQNDIKTYNSSKDFSLEIWNWISKRIHYTNINQTNGYKKLAEQIDKLEEEYKTCGNVLFYFAVPPSQFGTISAKLYESGLKQGKGWRRIIIEKPFGHDLRSAQALSKEILSYWDESQIYRVDHYLGKETVQNILVFRFANELFEPVWNKEHVDHIQLTVSESADVENRGYYDEAGVLRDVIQNHMLQMLSYLMMEPPISFSADDIRNEKGKVLKAVRIYTHQEALENTVRGQYDVGTKSDGTSSIPYRENPAIIEAREKRGLTTPSTTETFVALRLFIENWRWDGVPIYLRSGKALWKRGTDIVVQFKKAPVILFHDTIVTELPPNRIIFHIQPDQSIEAHFSARRRQVL